MSDEQTQDSVTDATGAHVEAIPEINVGDVLAASEVTDADKVLADAEKQPEKPVEEPKKAEDDKFAAKFAALSRKEKQLREREKAMETRLKDMEAKLAAREADVTAKYIDPERFKKEPLKVMEETGMSFKQLAEMVMNDGKPTTEHLLSESEKSVAAKIKALEDKIAEKEAKEAKDKHETQLAEFKGQIAKLVAEGEEYELIRAEEATELVYEVIEAHYNKTADENGQNGQILSNKEAADAVENYLLENAKKLTQVKKLQPPPAVEQAKPGEKKAATTLSNAHSASAQPSKQKFLSDDESKQAAAALIKWVE